MSPNMKKVSTSSSVKKGGGGIRGRVGTGVTGDKLRGTRLPSASGGLVWVSIYDMLLVFVGNCLVLLTFIICMVSYQSV